MVNFSYAVRVFKAELQSFLDLRIPIVKSVNSLEAEISPVKKCPPFPSYKKWRTHNATTLETPSLGQRFCRIKSDEDVPT